MLERSGDSDYLSVGESERATRDRNLSQNDRYMEAAKAFGAALDRLVQAYEADPAKRQDLSQEIQFQLWRSFARYDARCSLRTWVYRIAHNTAVSHVMRERRTLSKLVSLEELESISTQGDSQAAANQQLDAGRLLSTIRQLKPLDRQVMLSYLEGLDAVSIAEITGLSATAVAMRVHRSKNLLAARIHKGANHAR
jgi:RNA polymerase sigma-70 factor, ECF subfamily